MINREAIITLVVSALVIITTYFVGNDLLTGEYGFIIGVCEFLAVSAIAEFAGKKPRIVTMPLWSLAVALLIFHSTIVFDDNSIFGKQTSQSEVSDDKPSSAEEVIPLKDNVDEDPQGFLAKYGQRIIDMKFFLIGMVIMIAIFLISLKVKAKSELEEWQEKNKAWQELDEKEYNRQKLIQALFIYEYVPESMEMIRHNNQVIRAMIEKCTEEFTELELKFLQDFIKQTDLMIAENSLLWKNSLLMKELFNVLFA